MVLNEPLFAIRHNSVSLDVSLRYKAGIRINQRASWVGLGFDISLPYVERTVVGSADEKSGNSTCIDRYHNIKNYDRLLRLAGNGYVAQPDDANYTAQQDVYSLNADFARGRIVFAQPTASSERMKAYLQNWRSLKVDYAITGDAENADITEWRLVDENGITYVFSEPVTISADNGSHYNMPMSHSVLAMAGNWVSGGDIAYGNGYVNSEYNFRDRKSVV